MPDPTQPQQNGSPSDATIDKRSAVATSDAKSVASPEPAPSVANVAERRPPAAEVSKKDPEKMPAEEGGAPVPPANPIPAMRLVTDRIGIEIHSPPYPNGVWPKFLRVMQTVGKDYGGLITGLISLAVTIIIALLARSISTKQNEILDKQAQASVAQAKSAENQINEKFIEEFRKHLSDLTRSSTVEELRNKRLAAITLAQYGNRAWPALKISLAVNEEDIRKGAAEVIVQMLASRERRSDVLSQLQKYFDEDNPPLRVGVLDCYITINKGLKDDEFEEVRKRVSQYVNPWGDYRNQPEQQRVLLGAVKFLGFWERRSSKDFLLAVASNTTCDDDSREGALNYLPDVIQGATDVSAEERKVMIQDVTNTLQGLLPSASSGLKVNLEAAIKRLQPQ